MAKNPKVAVLKVSGEAIGYSDAESISGVLLSNLSGAIESALLDNPTVRLAIVIGGGNVFRGRNLAPFLKNDTNVVDKSFADYTGMAATLPNALALGGVLRNRGCKSVVLNAFNIEGIPHCEFYEVERAKEYLENGYVVILAGGTGKPKVTTDTAMVLRGQELGAKTVYKGTTKARGICDKDPNLHPEDAKLIPTLTYTSFLSGDYGNSLDREAVEMAQEHDMTIRVFKISNQDNLRLVLRGKDLGSIVRS